MLRPADHDGATPRSEALFYYFRLEDQIPENHLLQLIDKHTSFAFVRERLRDSHSDTGRPSIDPELLLRILLIGYLYGISSERKLVEELRMHLAWRWFTGLGFDQEIPHHSTFSKNRHGRFQESKLFEQLFEEIVVCCLEAGLVRGDNLSVDGSFVEANAAKESRIPRSSWWKMHKSADNTSISPSTCMRRRGNAPAKTPEFANAQRQRKKVEALFAELKNQIGLRGLRLRRMKFVREQFFLAAAAQNIKRLVRVLSQGPKPMLATT
jgi:transposase